MGSTSPARFEAGCQTCILVFLFKRLGNTLQHLLDPLVVLVLTRNVIVTPLLVLVYSPEEKEVEQNANYDERSDRP